MPEPAAGLNHGKAERIPLPVALAAVAAFATAIAVAGFFLFERMAGAAFGVATGVLAGIGMAWLWWRGARANLAAARTRLEQAVRERKTAEERLGRLNRSLRMVGVCNEALLRERHEQFLLHRICEVIVDTGGHRAAWVGFAHREDLQTVLRPVAWSGVGEDPARRLRVAWAETDREEDPIAAALRSGKRQIVDLARRNAPAATWREMALERGCVSVAVLPLAGRAGRFGVLCLGTSDPAAFSEDELPLLFNLADNLAHGIASLRTAGEQRALLNAAEVGIAFVRERRVVRYNRACGRLLGYDGQRLFGAPTRLLYWGDGGAEADDDEAYAALAMGGAYTADARLRRADGTDVWANVTMTAIDPADLSKGAILVLQDIDRRKRAERALREREEAMRLNTRAIEASANGILITDAVRPDNPITYVNPAFARITGYAAHEVLGRNPRFLLSGDTAQFGLAELRAAIDEQREASVVLKNRRKDGSAFWNELSISPVRDAAQRVTHYVGVINDVTARKDYEAQLERQANLDELTGLANRNLLKDRLAQAISYAARSGRIVAVLYLDLDRFKRVNDSLGHAVGDTLLRSVAARIAGCVRERDTVARLGGDEFVIVLPEMARAEDVAVVARKVLRELAVPAEAGGREITVSSSIGIALYPKDGTARESLLRNADAAMYGAKESGRNRYRFYTADMNARALERLELEARLHRALEREELLLHYQPLRRVADGAITDVEALIRWRVEGRGLVPPGEFIGLAEENGQIVPIGAWALGEACRQARRWMEAGLPAVGVAVNLSARQFREKGLLQSVRRALESSALSPRLLKLEITEGMVMHDVEEAAAILAELKSLGVGIAVDDFGTGYSSLAYLRRFPIDQLKIDRSFVSDIAAQPETAAIVRGIVGLARSLGMQTVAEGVESEQQLEILREAGCDWAQGYLISRPLPAEDIEALLCPGAAARVV